MDGTSKTFSPPRQARSRQSLERYLDAAESLIRTQGFADLNVTEVARLAGFSLGGLYSRFPNKLALLSAVRQRLLERVETALTAKNEAGRGTDASLSEALERMQGLLFHHFMAEREIFRAFMIEAPSNPGFEKGGEVATQRRKAMFSEALMAHADEIRHPDPEAAINWAFTVTMALIRERLVYGEAAR
jgi:AcrR family transcriptional regulator